MAPPQGQLPPVEQPELLLPIQSLTEIPGQAQGRQGIRLQPNQPVRQAFGQGAPLFPVPQQGSRGAGCQLPQFQGILGRVVAMALQHPGHQVGRQPGEGDPLAAGKDRGEEAIGGGADQDQDPLSRFFEGLEQGIGRRLGHHLRPLQHHQAAIALQGPAGQKAGHLPHLLQPQLGCVAAVDALLERL